MNPADFVRGWVLVLVACEALRLAMRAHEEAQVGGRIPIGFRGQWDKIVMPPASLWATWMDRSDLARRASVQARQATRAYGVSVDPVQTPWPGGK